MADNGIKLFILFYMMRELLRVMNILSRTNYNKGLFGSSEEGNYSMDETRTDDIPQVIVEENNLLTALYNVEEVKKDVLQMEHNKAPGPVGFSAEFTITFGKLSNLTYTSCLVSFILDNLSCFIRIFCEIILLPKV
jgi:hypothetical protein